MRILVTGGTNGMGRGLVEVLARQGHEVLVHGRVAARGEAYVEELAARTGNQGLAFVEADLTSLAATRAMAGEIAARWPSLDGVFVNAGIGYAAARVETDDGLDAHFQVNYLAHFALLLALMPLLERSEAGGRVVFNVSEGGEIHWDDLQMERTWGYVRGIDQAMLAKRMLLRHLHEATRTQGSPVSFVGYQTPKVVWSNQLQIIPWGMKAMASVMRLAGRFISIERSGELIAPLLTEAGAASRARSGHLVTWKRKRGYTALAEAGAVLDPAARERLWRTSLALCRDEALTALAERLVPAAADHRQAAAGAL